MTMFWAAFVGSLAALLVARRGRDDGVQGPAPQPEDR